MNTQQQNQLINLEQVIRETKPELKDSSINVYITNLSKLYKYVMNTHDDEIETLDFIFNLPKIDKFLEKKSLKTKANYYNNVITLYKYLIELKKVNNPQINNLYIEVQQRKSGYNYDIKKKTIENNKSKTKQEKIITMNEYNKFVNVLFERGHIQDYIIYKLLSIMPFRNEIATLLKMTPRQYKDLSKEEKRTKNYILLDRKGEKFYFIRNDYKTANKYGTIKTIFEKEHNEKFYTELLDWFNHSTTEYLFTKDEGKSDSPYRTQDISARLGYISNKYLGIGLSTSDIFKVIIANYKGGEMADYINFIKEKGRIRGTDVNTIIDHYVYKNTNTPAFEDSDE